MDPPFHKLEAPLTLSLGLNELATNAAKYGALASPTGRVTLTACVEAGENGDEFCLVWQEDGGQAVAPPPVAGFGTSMLSQAIEYQHEGKVELDWRKQGLICRLTLPIARATSLSASRQEAMRVAPAARPPRVAKVGLYMPDEGSI